MDSSALIAAARTASAKHNVSLPVMLAIAELESAGRPFAVFSGRSEPLIRFEGHYFDRRLKDEARERARAEGLAAPRAGAVANPAGQAARWSMLDRAAAINRQAAYESTSWGLGQVMGAHWEWLGFASVDAMVAACRKDAAGQFDVMARYIVKAGLGGAIIKGDWAAVARGYNGPGYAKNRYHTRLATAVAKWQKLVAAAPASAPKPAPAPSPVPTPKPAPAAPDEHEFPIIAAIGAAVLAVAGTALAYFFPNLFGG